MTLQEKYDKAGLTYNVAINRFHNFDMVSLLTFKHTEPLRMAMNEALLDLFDEMSDKKRSN